jgi:hypothetical protein
VVRDGCKTRARSDTHTQMKRYQQSGVRRAKK